MDSFSRHLEELQIRKELVKLGVRKHLSSWANRLLSQDRKQYEEYLQEGFKQTYTVSQCILNQLSAKEAGSLKKEFMQMGMTEEKAELWLATCPRHPELVKEFYGKGYPPDLAWILFQPNVYLGSLERTLDRVRREADSRGISEEEMLWEFLFYYGRVRGTDYYWHHAKRLGFTSVYLWGLYARYLKKHLSAKKVKMLRDFYTHNIGIRQIEAEWWIASEVETRILIGTDIRPTGLSLELIEEWKKAGVRNLSDIFRACFITLDNPEMSLEQMVDWYRQEVDYDEVSKWKKKHSPEEARRWKEIGVRYSEGIERIRPEEFTQLLEKTLCDVDELEQWLKENRFYKELVEDWIEVSVLDLKSYYILTRAGFKPEMIKNFFSHMSTTDLLEAVFKGQNAEELKQAVVKQSVNKKLHKLFRL